MKTGEEFFNLYSHDLLRVAVAVPGVRVADPAHNAGQVLAQMGEAAARHAAVVLFPELCLSAYSCEDLFQQRALPDASPAAPARGVGAPAALPLVAVVGLPLALEHQLYNCAAVVAGGRVLGVVPKTYLPNYREFYERRQFSSGDSAVRDTVDLPGARGVPFGSRLLFRLEDQPLATLHVELCEDLWVPLPPSTYAPLAGATLLLNLAPVAGAAPRRPGPPPSSREPQLLTADVDLERLSHERMRQTSFGQTLERHRRELPGRPGTPAHPPPL